MIICSLIIGSCSNKKPICPDEGHPHLIDLGLPNGTLWACCNVGANSPEDIGGYYAMGRDQSQIRFRRGQLSTW